MGTQPYVAKEGWELAGQLQSREAERPPLQEPQHGAEHGQSDSAGVAVCSLQLLRDARQQDERLPHLCEQNTFLWGKQ